MPDPVPTATPTTPALDPATQAALNAIINYQRGQRTVGGQDVATSQLGGSGIDPRSLPALPALGREGSYFAPGFFGSDIENLTYYDALGNPVPPGTPGSTPTPPPQGTPQPGGMGNVGAGNAGNSGNAGAAGDYAGHPGLDANGTNLVAPGAAYGQGANGFQSNQFDVGAYMGLTPGSMGYLDLGQIGSGALSASTMAPGMAGAAMSALQALGRAYNTYVTDSIRTDQGAGTTGGTITPLDFGQWVGSVLGLNKYGNLDAGDATVANPDQFTNFLNRQIPTIGPVGQQMPPTFTPGSIAETTMGQDYQEGPGGLLGMILHAIGLGGQTTGAMSVGETNRLIDPMHDPANPNYIGNVPYTNVPIGSATLPPDYQPPPMTPEEAVSLGLDPGQVGGGGAPEVPTGPDVAPTLADGTLNPSFVPPTKPAPPGQIGAQGTVGPVGPVGSAGGGRPEVSPVVAPTPRLPTGALNPNFVPPVKPPAPAAPGNAAGGVAPGGVTNPGSSGASMTTGAAGERGIGAGNTPPQPTGGKNSSVVQGLGGSGGNAGGAQSADSHNAGQTGGLGASGNPLGAGGNSQNGGMMARGGFVVDQNPAVAQALMRAVMREMGQPPANTNRATPPAPGMAAGGVVQQQQGNQDMAKKPINDGGGNWTHPSNTRAGSAVSKYPQKGAKPTAGKTPTSSTAGKPPTSKPNQQGRAPAGAQAPTPHAVVEVRVVNATGGRPGFAGGGMVAPATPGRTYADGGMIDDMTAPPVGAGGDPTMGQGEMPGPMNPEQPPSDGVVDNQEINTDEGEYVIQRESAGMYPPGVLDALNDPAMAAKLGPILQELIDLSGGAGDEPDMPMPPAAGAAPPAMPPAGGPGRGADMLAAISRNAA